MKTQRRTAQLAAWTSCCRARKTPHMMNNDKVYDCQTIHERSVCASSYDPAVDDHCASMEAVCAVQSTMINKSVCYRWFSHVKIFPD